MLDMEKILQQPNEEAREGEILSQLILFLEPLSPAEKAEALAGVIASLIQQNLNMGEYVNNFCQTFNMLTVAIQAPFMMITFPDWLETKDMSDEKRKKWLEEKHKEFQKTRRKIKLLDES